MAIRINKYLSEVGYCSRRVADRLIEEGKVTINGKTVNSGDGIAITQEPKIALIATSNDTEILLFDLA